LTFLRLTTKLACGEGEKKATENKVPHSKPHSGLNNEIRRQSIQYLLQWCVERRQFTVPAANPVCPVLWALNKVKDLDYGCSLAGEWLVGGLVSIGVGMDAFHSSIRTEVRWQPSDAIQKQAG